MAKQNAEILILEKEGPFRDRLRSLCAEMGKVSVAEDMESVLNLFTRRSFGLLLLDWDLIQLDFLSVLQMIDNFQPDARRIALFQTVELGQVIEVMKAGMSDVIWEHQDQSVLRGKIKDALSQEKPPAIAHAYILQLAESIAERATTQKIPLYQARREFFKTFLSQILKQQKIKRVKLAGLMRVTPRTLRRRLLE